MNDDSIMTIRFRTTLNQVMGQLDDYVQDQIPFALAGALYDVAVDAREEMRHKVSKIFTIRQPKPWAARALSFIPANKRSLRNQIKYGGDISIEIFSRDKDLGPLLTDGGKRTRADGKDMGVPIIGGGRRTLKTKLNRRTGADGILKNNPNAIVLTGKDGKRLMVITPKTYKRGVDKKKQHKPMFQMRPWVNIKPWWNARAVLLRKAEQQLPARFLQNYNEALKTRKKR